MPAGAPSFVFGDFELDPARFELRRAGRPVELSATPFRLLHFLLRERERVVPKAELLEAVWTDVKVSDSALSTALKDVRRALGDDGEGQRWIRTLRRRGIRFVGEVIEAEAGVARVASAAAAAARRPEASVTTILFADLIDSTGLFVRLGEERAKCALEAVHGRMTRVIEGHGGEELQWLGDGSMAAFESTADAVRAAVALQRAVAQGADGERLALRVGLNVGELRRQARGGYFGLPVIVASRLCDRAGAGQILATAVVAGLLAGRRAFRFRELGSASLKGVESPVPLCEVEYEIDRETPVAGATPFVGRSAELARLRAALGAAASGRGSLVLVTGEAGIGKSRLLAELMQEARDRGAKVLSGRCFEGEGARAYAPFSEALDAFVAEADHAELLADLGPYGAEIEMLTPRLRSRLPQLFELPRLGLGESRARLFYAVSDLVLSVSKRALVVLALDDLHWADGATVALLRYLARLVGRANVLLLGAYRDSEVGRGHPLSIVLPALKREVEYERVALAGLGPAQVTSLLAALAQHSVDARFAEFVTDQTGGNPFFLRELVVDLMEAGKLRRADGVWTTDLPLPALGVPEGVRQVIGARLARSSAAANRLLEAAAGWQGNFSFEVSRRAAGLGEREALDALDEALDAQLVRPAGGAGDQYQFSHDLIRYTLDSVASPSRRLRLHRRLAEETERVWGDAPGERSTEIASQYYLSRALPGGERGALHALAAAEKAEHAGAAEAAARCLRMALELTPENDPRRPRVLSRSALALARSLEPIEASHVAAQAAERLAASEGADAAVDFLVELANPLAVSSRPSVWELATRGLRLMGDRRDLRWVRLAILDLERQADVPEHPGIHVDHPVRHEITRLILEAKPRPETLRRLVIDENLALSSRRQALSIESAYLASAITGELRTAVSWRLDALRAALERGDLARACMELSDLANLRIALGELDAGQGCLDWARRIAGRVGEDSVLSFNLLACQATMAFTKDEGLEALLPAGEAVVRRAAPGLAFARAFTRAALACAYARLGQPETARPHLDALRVAVERAPGWAATYLGVLNLAIEAVWLGAPGDAVATLERNLREKVLAPDFRGAGMDARLSLGRLCAVAGRYDEASKWFAESRAVVDEQGARPLRAVCDHDEALMYVRRGRAGDAQLALPLLKTALDQFTTIGMTGWERRARDLLAGIQA